MFYIKVFSITFITTIVIFLISKKFNFLDLPQKGKLHVEPTPYTGGISFVISIILISTFFLFPEEIRIIINYGMLIALIGFIDDKYFLNPANKLILKSLIIFFFLERIGYLKSLGVYEYIGNIGLGPFSFLFTFLAIHLLINAFNYIDGIDGSALTLYLNALIILLMISNFNTDFKNCLLIFICISISILFFNLRFFNLPKVFIGNNGSYFLGFILSCLMIVASERLKIHPAKIIWCCSIIVYDFLAVNLSRIIRRKNIFKAENNHIHHLLLIKTNSNLASITILNIMNLSLGIIAINYIFPIGKIYSLLFYVMGFILFVILKRLIFSNKINRFKNTFYW